MKQCIFNFSICIWSAFHMALFTSGVDYVPHFVEQSSCWEGKSLAASHEIRCCTLTSSAKDASEYYMCVCLLTCSKWLEWLIWIILFVHIYIYIYIYISPMKYASSQLVYFIITYYFLLLVLAHLSHHEGEPSTRENIIHVYVKI